MPGFLERLAARLGFAQVASEMDAGDTQPRNVANLQGRMLNPILYANPRLQTTSTNLMNSSILVQRKSFQIYDKIRLDEQVWAALAFKKLAVLSTGWTVESPPDQDEDWEVTTFVREELDRMKGSFKNALRQMLTAFDYGFSVTEKMFEKGDDGYLHIAALNTVAPHDLRFQTDPFGCLIGVAQAGNKDPGISAQMPSTLPLDKVIVFSWEGEFGNWYGRSDLDRAHRAWLLKDQSMIWKGMCLERFGVPPILIDYDSVSMGGEAQSSLKKAFQAFQAGLAALIPRADKADAVRVTTVEMAGQVSQVFVPSINQDDQQIAKAILLPGLLGLTADVSVGSLARSSTHFDVFLMVCDFARELLAETIQESLIKQLVDYNFANVEDYPTFKLMPVADDVRQQLFDTWVQMAQAKVVVSTPADEAHVRKEMKFPDLDVAQASVPPAGNPNAPLPPPPPPAPGQPPTPGGQESPAAGTGDQPPAMGGDCPMCGQTMTGAKPAAGQQACPACGQPMPNGEQEPPEAFVERRSKKKFAFEPPRELTAYEKKVDFAQIESDFNDLGDAYIERIRKAIVKTEAALLQDVRKNYVPTIEYAQSITMLPQTDDLHSSVAAFLKDAFSRGQESLRREVPQIKAHADQQSLPNADLDAALSYLRAKSVQVSGVTEDKILADVKQALLTGVSKGSDLATMIDSLKAIFEPYVSQTADASGDLTNPSRLETIVRTNLTDVYNQGRLVEGAQASDFMEGWQYSAIIDNRTTEVCRMLDGVCLNADDPTVNAIKPPRHFNCFAGDTLVSTVSGISGASERWFAGDVIVIETADALVLTATPNHPILTSRGWIGAGALKVGDHVARYRRDAVAFIDIQDQAIEASIEQVVRSLGEARGMRSVLMPLAAEDFHHDAVEGEVASITSNRLLPDGVVAGAFEQLRKALLIFGEQAKVTITSLALAGLRTQGNLCFATFAPAHGGMSAFDAGIAGAQLDADRFEQPLDGRSRDAELARAILSGETGAIELSRIERVDVRDFAGHVYNLETESGHYVAGGLIVHNCRSVLVPIVVGETINPDDLITPAIAQSADDLSGKGF